MHVSQGSLALSPLSLEGPGKKSSHRRECVLLGKLCISAISFSLKYILISPSVVFIQKHLLKGLLCFYLFYSSEPEKGLKVGSHYPSDTWILSTSSHQGVPAHNWSIRSRDRRLNRFHCSLFPLWVTLIVRIFFCVLALRLFLGKHPSLISRSLRL